MNLHDANVYQVVPHAFTAAEVEWCESNYPALSGDQPSEFCSAFEGPEAIRQMELTTTAALLGIEKEFLSASAWHRARGRDLLSEKCRRLATVVHEVLKEKLN